MCGGCFRRVTDSIDGVEETHKEWICCGHTLPKDEIVYIVQVIPIYLVIICSLVHLITGLGDENIWSVLLGSALGYLLPNPSLRKDDVESIFRDFTQQQLRDGVRDSTPEPV